jgi:hypothetical protein
MPEARMLADDFGRTVLALNPHDDDPDRRVVVFAWDGCEHAILGDPNDEGLVEHPLWNAGLQNLLGVGEVIGESLGERWGRQRRHWIVPLKECLVDVVAEKCGFIRVEGTTAEAAVVVLDRDWAAVDFRSDSTSP